MIPEAAVEAALDVYLTKCNYNAEEIVRLVLEAAAPHMLAEVWEEGVGYALPGTKRGLKSFEEMRLANPYR